MTARWSDVKSCAVIDRASSSLMTSRISAESNAKLTIFNIKIPRVVSTLPGKTFNERNGQSEQGAAPTQSHRGDVHPSGANAVGRRGCDRGHCPLQTGAGARRYRYSGQRGDFEEHEGDH